MSYTRNNQGEGKQDGREPGKPHPQAEENYRSFVEKINKHLICNGLRMNIDKKNADGSIDPIVASFYWKAEGGNNFGHPVSFHQSREKFSDELTGLLNYLSKHGFLKSAVSV